MNKILVLIALVFIASCGKDDCPSGMNTTNPNCPNYYPYQYGQGQGQGNQCQPGTPNCVNGYYQYPCQPGTPNCINGYTQYPNNQYPNSQYPQYPNSQYPQYPQYPQQPRY